MTLPSRQLPINADRGFARRLILLLYILFLLEGPLRKWLIPSWSNYWLFLRDPFVLLLYAIAFKKAFLFCKGWIRSWIIFAFIVSLFGIAQFQLSGYSFLGWLLGIRSYWLYLPLAPIVAFAVRKQDLIYLLRLNACLVVPYALLIIAQYKAGSGALINSGAFGDEVSGIDLADGLVRPFGLFTYTAQHVQFTVASLSAFLSLYLAGAKYWLPLPLMALSALSLSSMVVLSGARGIFFLCIFLIGVVAAGLGGKSILAFRVFWGYFFLAGIVFLAWYVLTTFFPDMYYALEVRFQQAEQSEGSIWSRAFQPLLGLAAAIQSAPFLGYGIGSGASGVAQFLGLNSLAYGEIDIERNLNELGLVFGVSFVFMRFYAAYAISRNAFWLAKQNQPMALPFAGFSALQIAIGQVTHSALNGFLVWLFIGFQLAINRFGLQD